MIRVFFVLSLLAFFSFPALARESPAITDAPVTVKAAPEFPLDQPNVEMPALVSWAAKAASQAMTSSYLHYRQTK